MSNVVEPVTDGKVCRLCQVNCDDNRKCINGENSEMNEVYKITIKYFPAKFLGPYWRDTSSALCLECWRHIIEFHSFQETIFDIQKKPFGRQHEIDINIKDETILHTNDPVDKPKKELTPVSHITSNNWVPSAGKYQNIKNYGEVSCKEEYHIDLAMSYLEDIDIHFSTDDEMSVSSSLDTRKKVEIKTPTQNTPQCNVSQDSQTCHGKWKKLIKPRSDKTQCNPKLQCWVCSETVSTFDVLQNHFALYHNKGLCYITCCQVKITSKQELLEHTGFNHTPKESFMCEICKIEYPRASILKKHKLQRHTPTTKAQHFQCPECPNLFMTGAELEKHYNAHFLCHECSKVFPTTDGLTAHTLMVHNTTKKPATLAASLESFTCDKCDKPMKSRGSFETHTRFAHMNGCNYKCCFCEKAFKKPLHFRDHMNYHTKDNFYACPHCSNKYQYWALLDSHMNLTHANKCTPKHMYQLLLAEEAHVVIVKNLKNSSSKTNGNNASTKAL